MHHPFIHVTTELNLIQLSFAATRHDSFLDLVLVSPHFMNNVITNVAQLRGQIMKVNYARFTISLMGLGIQHRRLTQITLY